MRVNEGRKMFYWLAGAATLLLASVQPALAKCVADDWVEPKVKTITIDDDPAPVGDHIKERAQLQLLKRKGCNLQIKTLSTWPAEFADLKFDCEWEGDGRRPATYEDIDPPSKLKALVAQSTEKPWWDKFYNCEGTWLLTLHTDETGKPEKHRVALVPFVTKQGKHAIVIDLVEAEGGQHAGVAHGTGDE